LSVVVCQSVLSAIYSSQEPVTELKQPSDSPVRHENAEEQPEANEEAEVAGKEEAAMDLEEKQGDDGKESEIPFVDEVGFLIRFLHHPKPSNSLHTVIERLQEHQSESAPGLEQDRSSDEPQAFEVVETTAPKPSSESLEIKNAQEEVNCSYWGGSRVFAHRFPSSPETRHRSPTGRKALLRSPRNRGSESAFVSFSFWSLRYRRGRDGGLSR